ncbi:MAG: V-type ATP synthase subunit I [Oscillospiraceae bacterium]|nr:V-type ATP synthase subunit I [Oscillospiraceae bacterium]
MAQLAMRRIEIVTLLADSKAAVDFLQHAGVVELEQAEASAGLEQLSTAPTAARYKHLLRRAEAAKTIIDKAAPKPSLFASLTAPHEISPETYEEKEKHIESMLTECRAVLALVQSAQEHRAAIAKAQAKMESLRPWLPLDLPLCSRETNAVRAFAGTLPARYDEDSLRAALQDSTLCNAREQEWLDLTDFDVVSSTPEQSCVFVLCHKSAAQSAEQTLRKLGFVRPQKEGSVTARELLDGYTEKIAELEAELSSLEEEIAKSGELQADVEFLIDCLTLRLEKYAALEKLLVSRSTLILRGYIPKPCAVELVDSVEGRFAAAVSITEPEDGDDVPTCLQNNRFISPMEAVTNMYSPPSRSDVDPNPVMSVFYYAFFGLMLSDAGYGLLMVLAMLFAKGKLKLSDSMKKTTTMFLWCGVSTMFWGAMFGSWFGDIIQVIAREFFGKEIGSLKLWLDPVEQSMTLMLFCFAFGIIHLLAGYAVKFYKLWKQGERFSAVCDTLFISLLMVGIAPLGAGMIIAVPANISAAGTWFMLVGVGGILLTSGRSAKNIAGKLGGGLYGIYNAAAGLLGDVLSYSRLLALGLTTGVIASVVNMLGVMPQNPVVKAFVLALVFVLGHLVNMAINLIGAYVHTNRLQYVEFFSKFYEGGGKVFTPFAINTNYITIRTKEAKNG